MSAQVVADGFRQHDDAVLVALAGAHQDLAPVHLDIVDAQLTAFEDAKTTAVEQSSHQSEDAIGPSDGVEDAPHFCLREDDRQPLASAGTHGIDLTEADV